MRSNANIVVNRDKCYVCGTCVERCILDNLRMYLAPCRQACPIHMNCQGYIHLIAQGELKEAALEMCKDLPFAGIVGRVCTHPCERSCERLKFDGEAVHIRALKRYLADSMPEISRKITPVNQKSGKKVAIIGSGPAGLMAAYDLAISGHSVSVFDAASEPGGMLRWGIPDFRLPKKEITYSVNMLETMGVVFETGRVLGKELEIDKLECEWDAVFLAIGAGESAHLSIPGEDMKGVYFGLDLLKEVRGGKTPHLGKSVIVIGGGNAAVDTALTCRKLAVEHIEIVCLEEKENMPAFEAELKEVAEEGIIINDCWGPRKIVKETNGQLAIELSRCIKVFDNNGKFCPTLENECGLMPSADSVLIAIGQKLQRTGFPPDLLSEKENTLSANPLTLQTSRPNVFAGGDALYGPKSVIDAIASGREAAISINRMFNKESLGWGRKYWDGGCITDFPVDDSNAIRRPRNSLPRASVNDRKLYTEVEKTMTLKDAKKEAERCLNCGYPAEVNQTCWSCLPCEIECPVDALEVRMPYLIR